MSDALKFIQYKYNANLIEVLRNDFVEDFIVEFESLYDVLFKGDGFLEYDLTAPKYIKRDVVNYIRSQLLLSISKLDPKGDLDLVGINLDVFSTMPKKKERDSLKLFYFYLYGTPGIYVSISVEHHKKIFGSEPWKPVGRFGTMYMLPMDTYLEMYVNQHGGQRGWPSPSSIYHPFSGMPPSRIFERVQEKILAGFGKYFKKARDITIRS